MILQGAMLVAMAAAVPLPTQDWVEPTRYVGRWYEIARLPNRFQPAWLSFLPWVWGDYWILELDREYRFALVGEPSRKSLWILARTPVMDQAEYEELVARASRLGFDTSRLVRTAGRAVR